MYEHEISFLCVQISSREVKTPREDYCAAGGQATTPGGHEPRYTYVLFYSYTYLLPTWSRPEYNAHHFLIARVLLQSTHSILFTPPALLLFIIALYFVCKYRFQSVIILTWVQYL